MGAMTPPSRKSCYNFRVVSIDKVVDGDTIDVMCDSKKMYDILNSKNKTSDQIINDKIHFINQLTDHRNLKIMYKMIKPKNNLATKYLSTENEESVGKNSRDFV